MSLKPSAPVLCAHMQFVLTIVDDQSVEHPQRIHADQDRGLADEFPLFEYVQVRKGDARIEHLDRTQFDGRSGDDLAVLGHHRRTDDLVGPSPARAAPQGVAQGEIGDRRLAAGIDDGLHTHEADLRVYDDQVAAQRAEWNPYEIEARPFAARIRDGNSIVPKI